MAGWLGAHRVELLLCSLDVAQQVLVVSCCCFQLVQHAAQAEPHQLIPAAQEGYKR